MRLIYLASLCLHLSGCSYLHAFLPKGETVVQTQIKVVTPPPYLMQPVVAPGFVDAQSFNQQTCPQKVKLLQGYVLDLLVPLAQANQNMTTLRQWSQEQEKTP